VTEELDAATGENTLTYLAFDPGVSTGVCRFDKTGDETELKILRSLDELADYLEECEPASVVIYESYRIFGKKTQAHIGSDVPSAQAIGMIAAKARKWNAKIVNQPSNILTIAQLWTGVKIPSNHKESHDIAAFLHGAYYLTQQGIRPQRVLKESK
jgi:hypothetical protein